jgi:hypothetical protein
MKTTLNKLAAFLFLMCLGLLATAQNSNGQIKGIVLNDQHESMPGAIVQVLQGGVIMKQTTTDIDGKYTVKPLQPGLYEVLVSFTAYKLSRYSNVQVEAEQTSYVDVELEVNVLGDVVIEAKTDWKKPMVNPTYITMHKLDHQQISQMAVGKGDVKGMIANISSDIYVSDDGLLYSRGSRPGNSKTFVDGDLMPFDTDVSGMAIQNLTVITGGIPAQFGDVTGAVIIVTTRDYFSGIAEQKQRNNKRIENLKQKQADAEYEALKKKREEEIQKEKEEEELQKAKQKQTDTKQQGQN